MVGGIFGNRTILQNIIVSIGDNTSEFPNYRHAGDYLYDDGYIISEENKSRIDACLQQYPEMLYLHDLPPVDQDPDYPKETSSVLDYAHLIVASHGNGWGRHSTVHTITSVKAYLIELGAAIHVEGMSLRYIDMHRMDPQLLLGVNNSYNGYGDQHVYNKQCLLNLYQNQRLSLQDIGRLHKQAMYGLAYGNFPENVQRELRYIKTAIETLSSGLINVLNDEQLEVYAKHREVLQIIFLQGNHQENTNLPFEALVLILSYLAGISENEIMNIGDRMIENHSAQFPVFNLRRGFG